jgi:hypothetical protein
MINFTDLLLHNWSTVKFFNVFKKVRSDMICFSNFLFVNHGRFKSWRTLPPFVIFSNYFLKGTLSKICQIPCGGIKTLKNFTVDQLCSNAILVGSRDHRTQYWKGAIQGPFHQSLVAIGPVVSEEKIKMWNVDGRTTDDAKNRKRGDEILIVHCCSYMAMSSLTYIPGFSVKFFFQPIYTDYAN